MFKRFLSAILAFTFVVFSWFFIATRPITNTQTPAIEFEIKQGWGVNKIGQELKAAKLIKSPQAFKITVIATGISNRIQAGFFRLSSDMSITQITEKLTKASSHQVRITIQEGIRRQEIAQILEKAFKNYEDQTFSAVEFLAKTEDKEGRLFPDTYDFDTKSNATTIIQKLENHFTSVVTELKIPEKSLNNVVILASLLEREAANGTEMPQIAGVIQNRLDANWPLQIDATVQFVMANAQCKKIDCDWWPKNITTTNLQINSPYNTYKNQGLPPKPISNPGRSALQAASSPQNTTAWFYLHDNQGKIHFADSLEQHNRNICIYLQKDCK